MKKKAGLLGLRQTVVFAHYALTRIGLNLKPLKQLEEEAIKREQ